ncbi:ATP-binding cassette domain-containing protein [Paracoccus sp. YIM 132242]|uniref:Autoinducer 2 import ATP-binding protein LsrA n=1 Tax=Paracoccus lichenicola TaxID=2665644 RepID=A0A6L6HUN6_9RHOB|nr:sugar ABC transporter ATP-binding protein [Paracoccus lichenicola]MTE01893.1 ATP-binding cassette domain-containing protein [Paracoccus lichenicola]
MQQNQQPGVLRLDGVAHAYGPNRVLNGIDLSVGTGEVLALVGENGAGKSTLMKIVAGYLAPGQGAATWEGRPIPSDPQGAEAAGIVLVHQEFALIPDLSVAENILLGHEPTGRLGLIDYAAMRETARNALRLLKSDIDPRAGLAGLPVSSWQVVELAKAFAARPRLLLMDEPTAVLGAKEADALFACIRDFVAGGGSVIFTSHRLDEVLAISDRVAVLRDGEITLDRPTDALNEHDIASAMIGREMSDLFPPLSPLPTAAPILSVEGLSVARNFGSPVQDVGFDLAPGEILGIAGLVGAGRTELVEGLVGLRPATARRFALKGVERPLPDAVEAWQLGLAYLTEDRKARGLLLGENLQVNTALTVGALTGGTVLDPGAEARLYEQAQGRYSIRAASPRIAVGRLSGGNQQKVLIAKTLASEPEIVILDEPTRGVDIGAKGQIYQVIADLAAQGKAVIVISSEMSELIGLAHRILVLDRGRVAGIIAPPEGERPTERDILDLALGLGTQGTPL